MKIAISLFGDRISPRFDVSPEIELYEIEGVKITNSKKLSCEGWNEMERVQRLKEMGIKILICGGIPNNLHEILLINGIKVCPWKTGNSQDILENFLREQTTSKRTPGRKKHHISEKKKAMT